MFKKGHKRVINGKKYEFHSKYYDKKKALVEAKKLHEKRYNASILEMKENKETIYVIFYEKSEWRKKYA